MFLLLACCSLSGAENLKTPAAQNPGPPEPGVIKGVATTSDGRPLKSFEGSISGYIVKSGSKISANLESLDGAYATEIGVGQFAMRAWTDVEYNGGKFRIDLHPVDGKGALVKQDTKNGLIKNFIWKLDGFRPGADERSLDVYSHHGGTIDFNPEGHGVQYWTGIKRDYKHVPEPKIDPAATVHLTLTPDGPLIDGSQGKVIIFKIRGSDIKAYTDRKRRGIPIGRYKASATATLADGTVKPLRVTSYSQQMKEIPESSETATLEFRQSNPPSDTINRADEVIVHVMY